MFTVPLNNHADGMDRDYSVVKIVFKLLVVPALVFTLASCGGGGSNSGAAVEPMVEPTEAVTSIVTIGDSIGVGVGFGSSRPWPNVAANLLGVPLLRNQSLESQTTAWGLQQIRPLLDAHPNASHIFILMGTNDARQGMTSSAVANLQEMVNVANRRGVIPVIGTVIINTVDPAADARAREITASMRSIVGARIAETRTAIGDGSSTLFDGIHPNDAGQRAIGEAFVDAL
jgi:lysophospholipase L1-like esterase